MNAVVVGACGYLLILFTGSLVLCLYVSYSLSDASRKEHVRRFYM
jgi:hypothetical protein